MINLVKEKKSLSSSWAALLGKSDLSFLSHVMLEEMTSIELITMTISAYVHISF